MAGAVTVPGNVTRYAEANIINDAAAAKYVFESGLDITVVGLDVTLRTLLSGDDINAWKQPNSAIGNALAQMSDYYYANETDPDGNSVGGALHDPLAVDIALHPETITYQVPMNLTVEVGSESNGRTIGNLNRLTDETTTAIVCTNVEAADFSRRFATAILKLANRNQAQ